MHRTIINNSCTGENISYISHFRQYLIKSWWKMKINYSGWEGYEHCIMWTFFNMCVLSHIVACFMAFAERFKVPLSTFTAARGSSLISRPVLTYSRKQHVTLSPLSVVWKGTTEVKIFPNYLHVQFEYWDKGKVFVYISFSASFSLLVPLLAQDFQLDRDTYA